MVKKWLCVLSAGAIALSVTACGSGSDTESSASVSPASGTTAASSSPASTESASKDELKPEAGAVLKLWEDREALTFAKKAAEAFKAKYNVEVKIDEVPAPDQEARLVNDGPAGLGADVVMFAHDKLGDAVNGGLLLPNDIFESETKEHSLPAAIDAATFNGVLYGYPKSVETYALLYNKDLLKDPPKTWDDVTAFAKTFNDPAAKKYAIMWEARLGYFDYSFIAANGGYVFGKKGTDPNDIGLNNAGAVEGLKYFQTLHDILPAKAEDLTYDIKNQLFSDGKVAMNIDGPWALSSFKDKINLGVAPLPELPGGKKPVSFSGVRSYYVNANSKYPNAARLLAKFLTSKENELENFKLTGAIPANKEASEDPAVKNDPIVSAFLTQFKSSQPMPSIPAIASVWSPLESALTTIWNQKVDVQSTMDQAVHTIKEQIASTKK